MIQLSAILIDHWGQVLLSQDAATNTLAPPAAELQPGTLPTDTLAAAIRDHTGLIALPIRLTGVYSTDGGLTLAFRTIQRGGAIREEDGRPVAGFFEAIPAPEPMLPVHRQQLDDALHHSGGPPVFSAAATTLAGRLSRALNLAAPPPAEPAWTVRANLIIRNGDDIVWMRQTDDSHYRLPSVNVTAGELPNAAAARLAAQLTGRGASPRLVGLYLHPDQPLLEFAFGLSAEPAAMPATGMVRLAPGAEPDSCRPGQVAQVAEALTSPDDVTIRVLPATDTN